jgi:Tfx family DNA-binding protein|tara:strand:- start:278 stop:472 length:195 start_codon:yes stop_codon:yes gene_type:complete
MLTDKEREILELRKKGLTQSQVAAKLKISQPAVSAFENNALKKINDAKDVIELVKKLGIGYEKR